MSYCCCPPAITALLCLWVKSRFSKGVAGELTFFPPSPPFYKFQRCSCTTLKFKTQYVNYIIDALYAQKN